MSAFANFYRTMEFVSDEVERVNLYEGNPVWW
jgi:hypothetical protein